MDMQTLLISLALNQSVIDELQEKARTKYCPLVQVLFEEQHIDEKQFLSIVSQEYGMEYVPDLLDIYSEEYNKDEPTWTISYDNICAFPLQWLRQNMVIPLFDKQQELVLAITKPQAWVNNQEVYFTLNQRAIRAVLTSTDCINQLINKAYDQQGENSTEQLSASVHENISFDDEGINDILDNTSEAPFIRFVNMVLAQAVRTKVSDIHVEPYREFSKVRFRLDGILYDQHQLEKKYHAAVISRLKVMAKLNIAEKRLPQDGRIVIALGGREVSLRVSTLPTAFGERIVLRLLEKTEKVLSLKELGLSTNGLDSIQKHIQSTHGIILVTGPTGSGKTTTLYAALQNIASPHRNILTIEDPIEYELDGIGQVQVNNKIGLTFASGLRTLVRQDPDVILIGEIRDTETVAIAVQSALTGHLVLSTLHTNDAPSAITRLLDMGIESYLLSSVLRVIIAQRLVRTLCPMCKEKYIPSEADLNSLANAKHAVQTYLYRPTGCEHCLNSGYKGRIAIYEIMPITDAIKKSIVNKDDANTLRTIALNENMESLYYDGMLKVANGLTSITEIARVTDSI